MGHPEITELKSQLSFNIHCAPGGPVNKVKVGENVDWDVHSKQGVMFFKKPEGQKIINKITGTATFKPKEGDVVFEFEPVSV